MGRCQCKNLLNNQKSNMITPEANGNTTGGLDQPNPKKAEENDFKHNSTHILISLHISWLSL